MKTINTVEQLKAAPPGQYKLKGAALQKVINETLDAVQRRHTAVLLEQASVALNNFNKAASKTNKAVAAFKIEHGHKMPKVRKAKADVPKPVTKAIEDYKAAYKALYGAAIDVEYKDGYINGVSLKIFRQRIKQLQYRKGA